MDIPDDDIIIESNFLNQLNHQKIKYVIGKSNFYNVWIITDQNDEMRRLLFADFMNLTAAGGVVFNENRDVLLIFRRGLWDLPKGKLNLHESIKDCAIREVFEETMVSAIIIDDEPINTWHIYTENNCYYLKQTYWYLMRAIVSENLIPQEEEQITEVRWANNDFLLQYAYPNTFPMVKDVINTFQERYSGREL